MATSVKSRMASIDPIFIVVAFKTGLLKISPVLLHKKARKEPGFLGLARACFRA